MRSSPRLEPCIGCGALYPPSEGATHPYIGASAGCWALYGPLAAGQQPDERLLAESRVPPYTIARRPQRVAPASLMVDAYAAQHPGTPSPQAIQSVAVHLLTMHGVLVRELDPGRALWLRLRAVRVRGVFQWLTPPTEWALTVRHLFPGGGVDEPATGGAYVDSVYGAWETIHGATIASWYDRYVLAD